MGSQFVSGIHHITAIASDPQQNLYFYTQVLGLRPVKLTVNFDDPGTYHLYFGNTRGAPGVLFEIATDPPGFATDEPIEHLGEQSAVERLLPHLTLPKSIATPFAGTGRE